MSIYREGGLCLAWGGVPHPCVLVFLYFVFGFCLSLVWFSLEVFGFHFHVFYAVFLFTIEVLFLGLFRVFCVFRFLVLSCNFCELVWFRR